jgi:hypothetical protein
MLKICPTAYVHGLMLAAGQFHNFFAVIGGSAL